MSTDPKVSVNPRPGDDVTEVGWPWLGRCVADPEGFLRTHWTIRPYLESGAADRFLDIFTIEDFDRLLTMSTLGNFPGTMPRVKVIKDGRFSKNDTFVKTTKVASGQAPAIDCKRIAQLIRTGGTVALNAIDEVTPSVFALCHGIEQELSHHVGANAYLTPPQSQGHKTHYDTHDVIVLQVAGSKHWRVFDRTADTLPRPQYVTLEPGTLPIVDTLLTTGDTLYIPRGCPHSAAAADDMSLHVTLGIVQASLYDLLKHMLDSPALGAHLEIPLPTGFSTDALTLARMLTAGQKFLAEALNDPDAAREMAESFTRSWHQEDRHNQPGLITETISMLRGKTQ